MNEFGQKKSYTKTHFPQNHNKKNNIKNRN